MQSFFYDLHIHSCLSPCGDGDMTPNNIVNMALIKGLQIIAVADHNSCKNCPAVMAAARDTGLVVIPAMELCTSEEIHVVCLLPDLEHAMAFDRHVHQCLLPFPNDEAIFGQQIIMDGEDNEVGRESLLLVGATTISIDDVLPLVGRYEGWAFPSHIDRTTTSIVSSLGYVPPELGFSTLEVYRPQVFWANPALADLSETYHIITNSDAHYLPDIAEPERTLKLVTPCFEEIHRALGTRKK